MTLMRLLMGVVTAILFDIRSLHTFRVRVKERGRLRSRGSWCSLTPNRMQRKSTASFRRGILHDLAEHLSPMRLRAPGSGVHLVIDQNPRAIHALPFNQIV